MLEKLLEVARIVQGRKSNVSLIDQLNEGLPNNYKHGIAICFDEQGKYIRVKHDQRSSDVVYMSGPPNGCDPTAVSKFSGKTEKVVARLKRSLQDLAASSITQELHPLMSAMLEHYPQDTIVQDVNKALSELTAKDTYAYLFLAVYQAGRVKPLYLKEEVKEYLIDYALKSYSIPSKNLKNYSLLAEGRYCSICGEQRKLVYGNFSKLKCYNLANRGMISGGFNYHQATANFPVCKECIVGVSAGFTFAEKNLTFSLCGERYLLLPSVKDKKMRELVVDVIQRKTDRNTLQKKPLEQITASENELLEELAYSCGDTDSITLNMIFFEKEKAAWGITAEINEILPSRIQKIYQTKQEIEENQIMTISNKEESEGYHFTLKTLQQFTSSNGKIGKKKFLAYVDAVFSGSLKIEEASFMGDIVRSILSAYKQKAATASYVVRDAWASYKFLDSLNLIRKKGEDMDKLTGDTSPYSQFLEENRAFFRQMEKAVAFLTGCYVSQVLYVQHNNLGSEPFLKKLRGLKLDRKRLQAIYPEARNKLQQYDGLGLVAELDPLLAQSWVECADKWEISADEATFAFTLGLSLSRKIRQNKSTDGQKNSEIHNS